MAGSCKDRMHARSGGAGDGGVFGGDADERWRRRRRAGGGGGERPCGTHEADGHADADGGAIDPHKAGAALKHAPTRSSGGGGGGGGGSAAARDTARCAARKPPPTRQAGPLRRTAQVRAPPLRAHRAARRPPPSALGAG